MKRKGSVTAAPSCSSSAIALPPGAAQSKTYVEFHASMSLDNPTSALSFFAPSSSSSSSNASRAALSSHQQQLNASSPAKYEHTTLEEILKQRFRVWSQVHEQRETHLRTLQLALLHERKLRVDRKRPVQPQAAPTAATAPVADEARAPTRVELSAPDPANLTEQLIEAHEGFDGDDALDLFQLAM